LLYLDLKVSIVNIVRARVGAFYFCGGWVGEVWLKKIERHLKYVFTYNLLDGYLVWSTLFILIYMKYMLTKLWILRAF